MASRADHYYRAEQYLDKLDKMDKDLSKVDDLTMMTNPHAVMQIKANQDYLLKRAQIHATMAAAQVEGAS